LLLFQIGKPSAPKRRLSCLRDARLSLGAHPDSLQGTGMDYKITQPCPPGIEGPIKSYSWV
jgi:hypothetical protein